MKREATAIEAHHDTTDEPIGQPADALSKDNLVDYAAELADVLASLQSGRRKPHCWMTRDPRGELATRIAAASGSKSPSRTTVPRNQRRQTGPDR